MNATVSLVIPVYNSEMFLGKCLDSVIAQTYRELDIVCVNDGSTDASGAILDEYASRDNRIRVFTKENEGRGAASARNLGMEKAMGEYIQFLDSDDFFEPDMIETLVGKAEVTGAEVVICRGQTFDDKRQKVTGKLAHPDLCYAPDKGAFNWKECSSYICEIADFYAWNKLFRRKLLVDNNLKFTPIPIADDQDISMLAPVFASKVAVVDEAFINYRVNSGLSQCDSKTAHPEAAYEGIYTVVKQFKELGVWKDVRQSYLNVAIRLMREYFDSMTEYKKVKGLYNKYRKEIFPLLEAEELPEGFFHDPRVGSWYEMIITMPLEEIMFEAARATGATTTTSPMRFKAPFDRIEEGKRVVLIGSGLTARHWYSQFLLSGYCDVVCFAASRDDIPEGLEYDSIVDVSEMSK